MIIPPFPQKKHGVIYVDPPGQYKMRSDKGYTKSPQKHYKCMNYAEMAALRDDIIFATGRHAVCFMWAVWPMLPQAMDLMKHWGFEFKTGGAWHKRSKRWTPDCKKPKSAFGQPNIKNKSTRNIIEAAVREHSRKPDCVYGMLENLFDGDYLEMFSRSNRAGWESWGDEVGKYG